MKIINFYVSLSNFMNDLTESNALIFIEVMRHTRGSMDEYDNALLA